MSKGFKSWSRPVGVLALSTSLSLGFACGGKNGSGSQLPPPGTSSITFHLEDLKGTPLVGYVFTSVSPNPLPSTVMIDPSSQLVTNSSGEATVIYDFTDPSVTLFLTNIAIDWAAGSTCTQCCGLSGQFSVMGNFYVDSTSNVTVIANQACPAQQ